MDKKILIVEDRVDEAVYARTEIAKAGDNVIMVANTLEEALKQLEARPTIVLSDLFFPLGNLNIADYVRRILPHYERHEQIRYPVIDDREQDVLRIAVKQVADLFGVTPEVCVEEVLAKIGGISSVTSAARDAVYKRKNYEKWQKYLQLKKEISLGERFPSGVFLVEETKKLGIPIAIVTSSDHHGDEFEPVSKLIRVPYQDSVVDGRKRWTEALKQIQQ